MEKELQLTKIRTYIDNLFASDTTGHDTFHMKRVASMAKQIAEMEKANTFICEVAGLLHDVGDQKLFPSTSEALKEMDSFLTDIQLTHDEKKQINLAIKDVSFRKGKQPETLEGKIVQDADRIDALGAIGIARTFAFGGAKGQLIYVDNEAENTSIKHFYDKLLTLKDSMNTDFAKEIAVERHQFMETYLQQFFKEWK